MTIGEVRKAYLLARRLKLSGWWLLRDIERAARECNGIGPEWSPAWMRWIIDHLFPNLVIVAMIHDIRYFLGGTEGDRRCADAEFLANGYTVAEQFHVWWLPGRYIAEWIVRRMHRALRLGGGKAWLEAKHGGKV